MKKKIVNKCYTSLILWNILHVLGIYECMNLLYSCKCNVGYSITYFNMYD